MHRRSLLKAAGAAPALLVVGMPVGWAKKGLELDVFQAQFETTLLGVMRGVADYYRMALSTATLFGGTGHGFLLNISPTIEPAGPYVWNRSHFSRLAKNLGFELEDLGFYTAATPEPERSKVEARLLEALKEGTPCSLINMENQLITGYDETGFLTAGPWPGNQEFPPRHLSFGSWRELGAEIHMNFYAIHEVEAAPRDQMVHESLAYAVDLIENPTQHTHAPFGIAQDGYDNWLAAIDEYGSSHGNWWNAVVWGECHKYAGEYLAEIAQWLPAVSGPAGQLSRDYAAIGQGLIRASNREQPAAEKKALVSNLRTQELATRDGLLEILAFLRTG